MTKLLNGLLDDDQAVTCSCFERYPIYAIFHLWADLLLSRRRFEMSLWEVCWYGNYYQCSTLCRSLDKTSHFPESKEILIWMLLWHNEKEEISLNWAMQLLITLTNISFMSWHDTFRGCGACWAGGRYLASSQSKSESVKYQTNGSNHFLYQG